MARVAVEKEFEDFLIRETKEGQSIQDMLKEVMSYNSKTRI